MADARRTLESAANFTRGGGAPAPDHDATHAARAIRIEAEQRRLIQWAQENRKLSPGRWPFVEILSFCQNSALGDRLPPPFRVFGAFRG